VGLVLTAAACRYEIAATQLFVHDAQDGDGNDGPYFGVVHFQSTFGEPGSTRVSRVGKRHQLGSSIRQGSSVEVPVEVGHHVFEDVAFHVPDRTDGRVTIAGTIYLAMESDDVGWDPIIGGGVKDVLNDMVDELEVALEANVAQRRYNPLTGTSALASLQDALAAARPENNFLTKVGRALLKIIRQDADDPMGLGILVQYGLTDEQFASEIVPLLRLRLSGLDASCNPILVNADPERPGRFLLTKQSIHMSVCSMQTQRTIRVPFLNDAGARWELEHRLGPIAAD
jgi:hypothetical protein